MTQLEIERKFILRIPSFLKDLEHVDMVQIYLKSDRGTRRVRMIKTDSGKQYYFTHKIRNNDMSCLETERQISRDEYYLLLAEADEQRKPISKTRYYYPYKGLTFEIDVYPFWKKQCVMEVELESEDQQVEFPKELDILAEVTNDRMYKNAALAVYIPEEMA